MLKSVKQIIRSVSNIHYPNHRPNVFLFSTPRSGSTWLMELIGSQPGFKCCDEPLNLRNSLVRKHLGMTIWRDLYDDEADKALQAYFQGFIDGRFHFMNPNPFRSYYRPLSNRLVFKIIHGGEDRMNWFRDTFNGRVVYLLRHPIPVSLSREINPRLDTFLNSSYRHHFTNDQLEYAKRIFGSGTKLERSILSWCFQNSVPLRDETTGWVTISYEQMVLEPLPVINHLAEKAALPKPETMLRRLAVPSGVIAKSNEDTQQVLLEGRSSNRDKYLVEKWRRQVTEAEERMAMDILERFDIDAYKFGDVLPTDRLWLKTEDGT